jgi:hypothetical protein
MGWVVNVGAPGAARHVNHVAELHVNHAVNHLTPSRRTSSRQATQAPRTAAL